MRYTHAMKLFQEYIKHHTPMMIKGEMTKTTTFCTNRRCTECVVQLNCLSYRTDGFRPELSKRHVKVLERVHPEYFV